MEFAGPLWLGKLAGTEFCELMKKETRNRDFRLRPGITKLLTKIQNEIEAPISYFVVDKLSGALNLPVPPTRKVLEVLRARGFQAALTHFNPRGIRSDAPQIVVKEVICELTHDKL
jgi:tRNA (guanine26-N2/guanine27-N2)-dimethyltransferase